MLDDLVAVLTAGAAVVFLAAGATMIVRGVLGRRAVGAELAAQRIRFPAADALPADLARHAGSPVRTGGQARAYSAVIAANLAKATDGRTYSEIAADCTGGGHGDERLTRLRETAFTGQSLRGALLGAYQAWQVSLLVVGLGALFAVLGAVLLLVSLRGW
ncbi:hypothetical protein GCM10010492_58450 [Saccharothrix mutabilis subsp. mutabilis]|uniref:Uncharacterized protein n=2 Tax=Saccharothrix mutabilis TaxID=33921 RepID=A0ABP3E391_9PSEU